MQRIHFLPLTLDSQVSPAAQRWVEMADAVHLSRPNAQCKCYFLEESGIVFALPQAGSLRPLLGTPSQLPALFHLLDFNTY